MKRTPWTNQEDERIRHNYDMANGGFNTYEADAQGLNREFHEGRPVRNAQSYRRREGKVLNNRNYHDS